MVFWVWVGGVLLLAPGSALAFRVGTLEVKSDPGKPFVAEFPIRAESGEKITELHMGNGSDYRLLGLRFLEGSTDYQVTLKGSGENLRGVISGTGAPPRQGFDLVLTISSDQQTRFPQFSVDWGSGKDGAAKEGAATKGGTTAPPPASTSRPAAAPAVPVTDTTKPAARQAAPSDGGTQSSASRGASGKDKGSVKTTRDTVPTTAVEVVEDSSLSSKGRKVNPVAGVEGIDSASSTPPPVRAPVAPPKGGTGGKVANSAAPPPADLPSPRQVRESTERGTQHPPTPPAPADERMTRHASPSNPAPPLVVVQKGAQQGVPSSPEQTTLLQAQIEEARGALRLVEVRLKKLEERPDPAAGHSVNLEKRIAQLEDAVGRPVSQEEEIASENQRLQRMEEMDRRLRELEKLAPSRGAGGPVKGGEGVPTKAPPEVRLLPEGGGKVEEAGQISAAALAERGLAPSQPASRVETGFVAAVRAWFAQVKGGGGSGFWWGVGILLFLLVLWRGYRGSRHLAGGISVRKRPGRGPRLRSSAARPPAGDSKGLPRNVEPSFSSAATLYPASELDEAVSDVVIRKAPASHE
ncbi:MAG: hypothetical protein HQL66_04095 [Magnetococcales bacterium]|nr:hypothetical protein [Magnetococcales bacterium]